MRHYSDGFKGSRRIRDMRHRLFRVTPLPITVKTSRHTVTLGGFTTPLIEPWGHMDLTDGEVDTVREAVDRVIAQHRELYIELVMLINPKVGLGVLDGVAAEDVLVNALNELGDRMAKLLPAPSLLDTATMTFTVRSEIGAHHYQFDYALEDDSPRAARRTVRTDWQWNNLESPTNNILPTYLLARNFDAFLRWHTEVSIQLSRLGEIKNTIESA